MSLPVFEDVEPPPACGCEDCARKRLARAAAREPAALTGSGAARVVVVAAAAGTALGGSAVAAVAAPLPSGPAASATGAGTAAVPAPAAPAAAPLRLTRAQILERAETWVAAKVPYSMTALWKDGYRQDCSGFVSMAWGLGTSAWTGDLARYAVRVTKDQLRPGDVLLFDNAADPVNGSHVVIFGGWADDARTQYTGYEQTVPGTRVRTIPYAYWSNAAKYVPYRDKYLAGTAGSAPAASDGSTASAASDGSPGGRRPAGPGADSAARLPGPADWRHPVDRLGSGSGSGGGLGAPAGPAGPAPAGSYPGAAAFRPGQSSDSVLALGSRLVGKGFGAHYRVGPGRTWSEADRRNVEAFQRAQGWSGRAADGYPGPETWRRLFT